MGRGGTRTRYAAVLDRPPSEYSYRRARFGCDARQSLHLGDLKVHINGETEPCGQMEAAQAGLRDAMKPECRGGVYGNVVQAGPIRVGDTIRVVEESNPLNE